MERLLLADGTKRFLAPPEYFSIRQFPAMQLIINRAVNAAVS